MQRNIEYNTSRECFECMSWLTIFVVGERGRIDAYAIVVSVST